MLSVLAWPHVHALKHTHTHTHTHTHMHAHGHTDTHTDARTCRHKHSSLMEEKSQKIWLSVFIDT